MYLSNVGDENTYNLNDRIAVVTGSGKNIGKSIALELARLGATVVINGSKDQHAVNDVVSEIRALGGAALGVMADVSDPESIDNMVETVKTQLGSIDIAVSNVGIRRAMSFEEIDYQAWRSVLATNLDSAFLLARATLPDMGEAGWGRILHISGYDGFTGHIDRRAANVTAKAGMHGLTKALAREYGKYGVTANTIVVGAIDTERNPAEYAHIDMDEVLGRIPRGALGSAREVAAACAFLASPQASFINGHALHVNGGEFMI